MSVRLMEINTTLSFASRTFQIRSCFWKALRYLAPKQVNLSLFFFLIFFFFLFLKSCFESVSSILIKGWGNF